MKTVMIDYEGRKITEAARDEATHVIVSRKGDGDIRVQTTDDPVHALVQAQHDGDEAARMASIDDDRATFTVVPDYDPDDTPTDEVAKRYRIVETLVVALIVIALVVAFFVAYL